MTDKTLFLAWQDKRLSRAWFPVGRLDVLADRGTFRFRYVKGAERARRQAGFDAVMDFPDWERTYESRVLFPLFKNRIIPAGRGDLDAYLRRLDLPDRAEPAEILGVDGGYRATDNFEVFPKIERAADGRFHSRFFLHGSRHLNPEAVRRMEGLTAGEALLVVIELANPATGLAVQIQTLDYFVIGWAPRYLVADLVQAVAVFPGDYRAQVVRVNPVPAPSKQRVLVELSGPWPDYEPMTAGDFEPLAH